MGGSATLRSPEAVLRLRAASVDKPYYYLQNFETVVSWVLCHHRDLLLAAEKDLLEEFPTLPLESRALLVRMIMRKGSVFRASKLHYNEIGPVDKAVQPLFASGWLAPDSPLELTQLFTLLTGKELAAAFDKLLPAKGRKIDWLAALAPKFPTALRFNEWYRDSADCVYTLLQMPLCDRLRLMFFGNLYQDWSEFILADLGIYRYETVAFSESSKAFRTRCDIDTYWQVHCCRERFEAGEPVAGLLEELRCITTDNAWIEQRRAKLLFRIAQHCERTDLELALAVYSQTEYPGARARRVRVLERLRRYAEAMSLCDTALHCPESEEETQQLQRIHPRLQRYLGTPVARRRIATTHARIDLVLPRPSDPYYVEDLVQTRLHQERAPVHYVENTLINSLFGLLCWDAIFAPVPGAFFHPFQHGPADLLSPEFYRVRANLLDGLLAELDTGAYLTTIRANFQSKQGLQSPFVYWSALDENLLEQALACLPAAHLRKLFQRLLTDIHSNRAGLPDLIQFWPEERRYQMIEVKGPGDRLQDNQVRWLKFCALHGIPITVCYVKWQDAMS